jgi:4-amino-4-deoxy-L-arabinose transferase-like glycosyltransferase
MNAEKNAAGDRAGATAARRDPSTRGLWLWYGAGAAAFLPALGFYYVGEEAIFPKASLEMWYRGDWVRQFLVGINHQHNPLFNWIIIAACQLVGWEWMLQVARAVAIAATVASGLVLAWLAQRLFADARFAAFAALLYLGLADLALYRGWLAYVDPLFGFLVFSAMACLWVGCHERSAALLALAVAALTASFLAKAFTAYAFYGTVGLVLLLERGQRRFLLGPASLAIHAAGALALWVWLAATPGTEGQGLRLLKEVFDKFGFGSAAEYLVKLVAYPAETALKLSPPALLALYYARARPWRQDPQRALVARAAAIAALGFLPYWLAPQSHTRYLVPLYPLAALLFARVLWSAGQAARAAAVRGFVALLALKLVFVLALFPYYQRTYRGENYAQAARAILERTQGHALYTTNVSASGLSVAAHLDLLRLPAPPLAWPPAQWESGFVIAYTPDPALGRVAERYRLGGNELYLLCRGSACEAKAPALGRAPGG